MKERGNRDRMVIATKYTNRYKDAAINCSGNSKRSMHVSVRIFSSKVSVVPSVLLTRELRSEIRSRNSRPIG